MAQQHAEQAASTQPLAPLYYRDNFLRLCATVTERYQDLLIEEETAFLDLFHHLPGSAQCLYIRLVSRVGPWFREDTLDYPEIGELAEPLSILLASGLALPAAELTVADLGQLYTRAELQSLFAGDITGQASTRKDAVLLAIEELDLSRGRLADIACAGERARIVTPVGTEIVARLQVLFFGNRHQSLTDFILEDLGLTRYYPYALDQSQRLFSNREAFEEYLACAGFADLRHELLELAATDELVELAEALASIDIRFPSSQRRYWRLCNSLARDLERLEHFPLALELYQRSNLHPARERRARILEKQEQWSAAQGLCEDILASPYCEAEQEAAQRIQTRLRRKLQGKPQPRRRDQFDEVQLEFPRSETVELATAEHLGGHWAGVHYVENSLMNTLFGLAFWEEIFTPIEGAFHHAYQAAPADMYDASFRQQRAQGLDDKLRALSAGSLAERLLASYQRHQGYQCHWTHWRYIDETLVKAALAAIPAQHLLAIWERMLFDPAQNRRGFPDLIALGTKSGDYCMIEVKGPGDALQDNQKRWLRFFQQQGIPAQVAWVTWSDGDD